MAITEFTSPAVTGDRAVDTPLGISMTMGAFVAISWYSALELLVVMFTTFRRFNGVYFWSLLVSTSGIFVFSLAFLMKFYRIWTNNYISVVFITIGWYAMVTGQSLVLWSRLHLIVRDERKIKWVLTMIIVNVFLFHVPTTVLTFGSNSPQSKKFAYPYMVMERVQVTAFCIQEFIISGVYVWETYRLLQPSESFRKETTRRVMRHLIYVNIFVIILDVTLLCLQFLGQYHIQITYKSFVYAVKLKLEFLILNKLMELARPHRSTSGSNGRIPGFTGSRTKEIPLYRLGGQEDVNSSGQQEVFSPLGYAVTAGRGRIQPDNMKENCVMTTTEVKVMSTKRNSATTIDGSDRVIANSSDPELGFGAPRPIRAAKGPSSHSPSSSQTEFAGAGY